MILLNAGHQNNLGIIKHMWQIQDFYIHTTDRLFSIKTYFRKCVLLQAIVHTEINVFINVP